MKSVSINGAKTTRQEKLSFIGIVKQFVFNPVKSGLIGFTAFFSILLLTKFFSYLIGTYDEFAVDIDDVFLSIIGFILVFLIRFLENFKQAET